jgi:hypothetical protein
MSIAAAYLERTKVDQLAEEFRQAGYRVHLEDGEDDGSRYDLVAEQGDRKIAVEVVARTRLRDDTVVDKVAVLREQARHRGFDEFRLVLVSPPRNTVVEVEGLETLLFETIVNDIPSELDILSSHTRIVNISDVEITETAIGKEGIQITGTGIILVDLEYGGGEERDGLNEEIDFPFYFDLLLSTSLDLEQVRSLRVDTESFYR